MVNSANNFVSLNIAGVNMHISYTVRFHITAISQDGNNSPKCCTQKSNSNAKWPPLSYTKRLFVGPICQVNQPKATKPNKELFILCQEPDTANFRNNFLPFYLNTRTQL